MACVGTERLHAFNNIYLKYRLPPTAATSKHLRVHSTPVSNLPHPTLSQDNQQSGDSSMLMLLV